MDGQRHAPAALTPGKIRYPSYRTLGGPQGRSGRVLKTSPPPGFDPRTVQPVASRYTGWAIPAHYRTSSNKGRLYDPGLACREMCYNIVQSLTHMTCCQVGTCSPFALPCDVRLRHYQQFSIITQPRTNGRYSIPDIKRGFVKSCHQKHGSFENGGLAVSSKSLSVLGASRIHCAAFQWLEVSPFSERASDTVIKGTFRRTCEKIHSFAMRFLIGLPRVSRISTGGIADVLLSLGTSWKRCIYTNSGHFFFSYGLSGKRITSIFRRFSEKTAKTEY